MTIRSSAVQKVIQGNPDHDMDQLIAFIRGELPEADLTDDQILTYHKINFADDQLRRLIPAKSVAYMIAKKFQCSITTGYNVISLAREVFGATRKENKDFLRSILTEKIYEDMEKARRKGDMNSVAKFYNLLIKMNNLDKDLPESADLPPPPAVINFMFDPALLGIQQDEDIEKKVEEYMKRNTIDVTPISDDEEEND